MQKAKEIGLINYTSTLKNIHKEIKQFIETTIKTTSENSIKETKEMLYKWLNLEQKLEKAAELNALNRKTEDFKKNDENSFNILYTRYRNNSSHFDALLKKK